MLKDVVLLLGAFIIAVIVVVNVAQQITSMVGF